MALGVPLAWPWWRAESPAVRSKPMLLALAPAGVGLLGGRGAGRIVGDLAAGVLDTLPGADGLRGLIDTGGIGRIRRRRVTGW